MLLKDDHYWLPKKESPSSHILKFELSDYRHLPAYATFTTLRADAIELPLVDIQLRSIADAHFALIERWYRHPLENGRIARLHQEEFCQALDFGHQRKYREHGGPTVADCYQLVQDVSSDPANDVQHLLCWQAFNVLAGNSDGHAKKLSLLNRTNDEIRSVPFYDFVSTRAIERIDYRLAFSVGDKRNPVVVTLKQWETLANHCGLRPHFLRDHVLDVATRLLDNLQSVRKNFEILYADMRHCNGLNRLQPSSVSARSMNRKRCCFIPSGKSKKSVIVGVIQEFPVEGSPSSLQLPDGESRPPPARLIVSAFFPEISLAVIREKHRQLPSASAPGIRGN